MNECLEICTKSSGCKEGGYGNTHRVCKYISPDGYNELNKHFE